MDSGKGVVAELKARAEARVRDDPREKEEEKESESWSMVKKEPSGQEICG